MDRGSSEAVTFERVHELETLVRRLRAVLSVTYELTATIELESLLRKIVYTAAELIDSEAASLLLFDECSNELRFRIATGNAAPRLSNMSVPLEGSIAGQVFVSGTPVIAPNVKEVPTYYREVEEQTGVVVHSLLAVPLRIQERSIGVLEVINKRDGRPSFGTDDVEILTALACQAAIAIENARLLTALQEAYDRVSKLDRLKSDFIAIASHELRTPLSLVLGHCVLLQEDLDPKAAERMRIVVHAAMKMKSVVETMLNLRYLETGELELNPAWFDVRQAVSEACEAYREIAEDDGLTIEVSLPEEEVPVWADRGCLQVVLDNLLSNAVKFNRPGGRIWVSVTAGESQVEIRVADTGIGIPTEYLEQIFERFFQVEQHMQRKRGGMGLGLSIVRELVTRHNGRVWAESVPGEGSCFHVALPRYSSVQEAERALSQSRFATLLEGGQEEAPDALE